jgi:hypothetical protein
MVVLTACAEPLPSAPAASASPEAATPIATAQPEPSTSSPAVVDLPVPGRPWDAATLLAAMRSSTRPGGVPDELESSGLADAIASSIWTVDATPWDTVSIGGFCGASTCTLDVAGSRHDRAGEDLWTLEIARASGAIEVLVADVRSLPPELVADLDRLVRALLSEVDADGLVLANARWLPPPAKDGRFVLSYRSGGEEGSCAREITIDAPDGEVVEETANGC